MKLIFAAFFTLASAHHMDYDQWDFLTKTYFRTNTLWHGVNKTVVDYCGFSKDKRFGDVINSIAKADLTKDGKPVVTRDEWFAAHINIYNVMVIATIIKHPYFENSNKCIESIQNVTVGVNTGFDIPAWNVGGVMLSLDDIEDRITSKMKSDWALEPDCRVHATIVCAGISCPNLRRGAFYPDQVYDQMQEEFELWMTNGDIGARRGNLGGQADLFYVTHIFYWFRDQFSYCSESGGFGGKPSDWIVNYLTPDGVDYFTDPKNQPLELQYMPYNWNLNGPYECRDCEF